MNRNDHENRITINFLHRLLRHNPHRPRPLHVTVSRPGEGQSAVNVDGIEMTFPASAYRETEETLRFMLQHYPEPAFINGQEVERAAFDENPAIIRTAETGTFPNSHLKRTNLNGGNGGNAGNPPGLILSEGLTYLSEGESGPRKTVLPGEPPPGEALQIRAADSVKVAG